MAKRVCRPAVLATWQCGAADCGARNLEMEPACTTCHRERPKDVRAHPQLFGAVQERDKVAPALPPVDLEEFLRRNFERKVFRLQAEAHEIGGELYLTLNPEGCEGRVWRVDENDLVPCDSHGRVSW